MPRTKQLRKRTDKQNAGINNMVKAFLTLHGAREITRPGGTPRYAIDTTCGRLEVTPYGTWVACRFDDVERAAEVLGGSLGFNEYSGKWNVHYDDCALVVDALAIIFNHLSQVIDT